MKRNGFPGLALVVAVLSSACFSRAEEVGALRKRIERALATTYYQGILVTVKKEGAGREEEVARAWFGPLGRQALEIISPHWRSGERLVVEAKYSWLYYPDCRAVLRLPAENRTARSFFPAGGIRLGGRKRTGGREAFVLVWENERGTRRVWFDAEHLVPIRREDRSPRGELVFAQILEEVAFPAVPPRGPLSFTPGEGVVVYTDEDAFHRAVSLPHVQRDLDFRIRLPGFLPAGIRFRRAFRREFPRLAAVQLRFDDGGNRAFSLFEYRAPRVLSSSVGRFLAGLGRGEREGFHYKRWRAGELEFILVGNLRPALLDRIAESIR